MFFILLTFFAALFIEGLGSLVSVIGISALFGANPIIIALAISLDVGKIVVVSLLYTHWKTLSKLMKGYALVAAAVTMIITSSGAAGYLSGQFQQAIIGTQEGALQVSVLKEQQAKYQTRKKQIDDQIAALPEKTTVNQRLRLINGFKAEQNRLDQQIQDIDKQLPQLQVKQIGTEAKAGPILYVAKAFDITVEQAVKWVILLIIFVFDPLAIFLIIAGNFLWARRKEEKALVVVKEEVRANRLPPAPNVNGHFIPDEDDNVNSVYVAPDGEIIRPQLSPELMAFPPVGLEFPVTEGYKPIYEELTPTPRPEGTGVLSPIVVEEPEQVEPIHDEQNPTVPVTSSLSHIVPDAMTVVDGQSRQGFRPATTNFPESK